MDLNKLQGMAAIAISLLIVPGAWAQGVKVNGKEIPQSRIDAGVKSRISQGQPDTPELRKSVKDALINQE
ncbi:MAG TPA: peptidylprolyl isomerase, partial [Burkholderiales bacterium]|nr:peptidylprolyl isomerase [Burkholderiales bacterium]